MALYSKSRSQDACLTSERSSLGALLDFDRDSVTGRGKRFDAFQVRQTVWLGKTLDRCDNVVRATQCARTSGCVLGSSITS